MISIFGPLVFIPNAEFFNVNNTPNLLSHNSPLWKNTIGLSEPYRKVSHTLNKLYAVYLLFMKEDKLRLKTVYVKELTK